MSSILPSPLHDFLLDLNLLNPLNQFLLLILTYLIYTLYPSIPELPLPSTLPNQPTKYNWRPKSHGECLVWRTYTEGELREFDGVDGKRILFAIRRKVYDVSSGRGFYGPGGPYSIFAGKDASRGLAKQSFEENMITPFGEPIDGLEDLSKTDWDGLKDWEDHFNNKYIMCGDYVSS